jgi:hypothetical protein
MKYIITESQYSIIQTNNPSSIIKLVEKLYTTVDMEGICELDVGYDEEDNNFYCYLIIDKDWYTKIPLEKDLKNVKIRKYAKELKEKINNFLGIHMFVGHYVNPLSCKK